jgi:steroid delta-isomerase-like uncharacterized protein
MTLESHKALVRKWIDAWIVSDLDILDEIFAPDYRVNEALIGIEGVKQAVHFLHTALSDISAELHEVVAEHDKVVIHWTIRGRHAGPFMGIPPTGKELLLEGINIYRIVDGKIITNHEQTNVSEVIQRLKADSAIDTI